MVNLWIIYLWLVDMLNLWIIYMEIDIEISPEIQVLPSDKRLHNYGKSPFIIEKTNYICDQVQ